MFSLKSAVATIVVPGTACFVLSYFILTAGEPLTRP